MKRTIQFSLITLMFVPLMAVASTNVKPIKTTKEKVIKKSFNVSPNATLKVNNSYGNLDIVSWDENRIEFDITIKVTGDDIEKVKSRLNEIDVKFSSSSDWVTAETLFGNKKKSWWNWSSSKNLKIEVHYRIKMPMSNNVNLNNDYGTINLDKLTGKAILNCDYGKITTKELMADDNVINFDYSNNCYFEYIKTGKINADYSGFTLAKTNSIHINADYTKSVVEASEDLTYNCDYGSLLVNNVNNLEGNGDYLSLRLGTVYKTAKIKADYGSIKIDRMASKAGNLEIDSDYVGITIGLDKDYNFNFDINLEYGSLRDADGFNFSTKKTDHFKKYYNGYKGSKTSGNLVKIKSQYGSVTFKKS